MEIRNSDCNDMFILKIRALVRHNEIRRSALFIETLFLNS